MTYDQNIPAPDHILAIDVPRSWGNEVVVILSEIVSKAIIRSGGYQAGPEEEHSGGWKASSGAVFVAIADSNMELPYSQLFIISSNLHFSTVDVKKKNHLESIETANATGL